MPPNIVVVTADNQSEEDSKEIEVVEMQNLSAAPVPSPELLAEGGGGSQHSLASIEDGPAVQEMEEDTVRVKFQ